MNLQAPAKPTWQCHACDHVWMPDPAHAEGGTWEPSEGRLEGVPHKYCPTCLAARQAAMAGLSTSIAEVIEHPETTPTPAPEPASVASGRGRSRLIAAAIAGAAVIAGGVVYAIVRSGSDKPEPAKVEKSARGGVELVAPVGGAWMATGDRNAPAGPDARRGSRAAAPTGNVGPASVREPWAVPGGGTSGPGGVRPTHSSGPAATPGAERPTTGTGFVPNGEGASGGEASSGAPSFSSPTDEFPQTEPEAPVTPEPPVTLPPAPEPVVPPALPQPQQNPLPTLPPEISQVPPQ
jgi:hypothetical protein